MLARALRDASRRKRVPPFIHFPAAYHNKCIFRKKELNNKLFTRIWLICVAEALGSAAAGEMRDAPPSD
jgi:hypothetical protein